MKQNQSPLKTWRDPELVLISQVNIHGGGPITFAYELNQKTPNNYRVERKSDHAVFSGINRTQNAQYEAHS